MIKKLTRTALQLILFLHIGSAMAAIKSEQVQYQAGDTKLQGYLAWDDSNAEKRPGVLVIHEWWGHNAYARKRADMLAQLGYLAFAVDMYGEGKNTQHPKEAQAFMEAVTQNMDVAVARFKAAEELLKDHPLYQSDKIAAIGYCFGGGMVLHMARQGIPLNGVASFHGSLQTQSPAQAGKVKSKILVLHGDNDQFIPQQHVDDFKKEMDQAKASYKFVAYPNAPHSFTNPEAEKLGKEFDIPVGYDAEADEKSWLELQKFLQEIF